MYTMSKIGIIFLVFSLSYGKVVWISSNIIVDHKAHFKLSLFFIHGVLLFSTLIAQANA